MPPVEEALPSTQSAEEEALEATLLTGELLAETPDGSWLSDSYIPPPEPPFVSTC